MKASEILVSVGEPMSFPEHLSSPAWPLLASLSAFWLRVSEKLSSLRHGDRVTLKHEKSKKKWQKKRRNQQISRSFIFCTGLRWQYLISVSRESARLPLSPKVQRVGWVIFLGLSLFWWCTVVVTCAHTRAHKHRHTSQLYGFQWGVWLDTGYSWCLSGGSNQSYWAALLPLMVCIIRYKNTVSVSTDGDVGRMSRKKNLHADTS